MIIAIDFDGTIVTNKYPGVGELMTNAKETINELFKEHAIIINTCRAGEHLEACKAFLRENSINYHFINENASIRINQYGTDTRKVSADLYVDDKNIGGFRGWKYVRNYIHKYVNSKPLVIAVVGESGSGKTQLCRELELEFGIPQVKSFTTRPKRTPDEEGHLFVDDAEFDLLEPIAYTEFGGHRYCATFDQLDRENLYVVDEAGLDCLLKDDRIEVKSIRVSCNKTERVERAGEERVKRDEGMFNKPHSLFDASWRTDTWRLSSYQREKEIVSLHELILKWTNRI